MMSRRAHLEQISQMADANRRLQDKLQTETRQLQESHRLMQRTRSEHTQKFKDQREDAAAQVERVAQEAQERCEDQLEKLGLNHKLQLQQQEQKFFMRSHAQLDETRSLHAKEREEALVRLKLDLDSQTTQKLEQQEKILTEKFARRNLELEEALRLRVRDEQTQQQKQMFAYGEKEKQLLESKLIFESESQLQVKL